MLFVRIFDTVTKIKKRKINNKFVSFVGDVNRLIDPYPHSKSHHHPKHLPKIRKAKSQSFRTRRSPSERRSPNSFVPFNLGVTAPFDRKRSPSQKSPNTSASHLSQNENKVSPGSASSKSPFSLSRQGTLRSSHSRKNSAGNTLNTNTGRRSPQQLISPSGKTYTPLIPDTSFFPDSILSV